MKKKLTTTRISPEALDILRNVAEITGEKQYRVIERILQAELDRQAQDDEHERAEAVQESA